MSRRSPWDRPRIAPLQALPTTEQPPKMDQVRHIGAHALTEILKMGIEAEETGTMVLHAQDATKVVQFRAGPRVGCHFYAQVGPNSFQSVANEVSLCLTMEDGTKLLGAMFAGSYRMLWLNPDWPAGLLAYLRTLLNHPLKMHIHDATQKLPQGVVVIPGEPPIPPSVPGDF